MTFTKPPPERPNSTDAPFWMTWNSRTDSCDTVNGARPSAEPSPDEPPKNASL